MMLAALMNVPKTEEQWRQFSYDHRNSHDKIRAAILKKYGVNLVDYQIEPINPDNIRQFLQDNASLHSAMNGVLQSQSSDLLDVDFTDPRQLDSWVNLNYQEHENAEQLLGI
jgi:ABC-type nitrate/sulfonate/bicarbonate transport system substrate-binding protein